MEKKTKHTPAPWHVQVRELWIDVVSEYNDRIVSIDREDEEHATHDARLIASAPDLLQFIKNISGEMLRCDFVLDEKWVDKAHELIKKATGDE